jgi:hypothetical protein
MLLSVVDEGRLIIDLSDRDAERQWWSLNGDPVE